MKRIDLLEKLGTVAPALANNDILPIMTHLWFTGDDVMAFNGHVGISVPLKTEFVGAVPGDMLISLLKALSAKEVEFDDDGKQWSLKTASTRVKLATMDADQFHDVHQMPPAPKGVLGCDPDRFLAAIDLCLRSVSGDTSVPDQLGITIIPGNDHVAFYGTNNQTLSRAEIPLRGNIPLPRRSILPSLFCRELLALAPKKEKLHLWINQKFALYARPDGVKLTGNLIESEKPLAFGEIFDDYHPPANDDKLVPIAEKLANVIERACIVATSENKSVRTRVTVDRGAASFVTKTPLHEIRDRMDLPTKHPDVEIDIDPKWVKVGLGDFDHMLITRKAFVMANKVGYYLVSGKG